MKLGLQFLTIIVACGLALPPGPACARKAKIAVIPLGQGDGLLMTAQLARAIVSILDKEGKPARLAYPRLAPLREIKDRHASRMMKKSFKRFQLLDFDAVKRNARKVLKRYKKAVKRDGKPAKYVMALHLLAAAELFDGKQDEAFKHMNDAYLFDRKPPPAKLFNPTVQQLHAKVQAATEHLGSVSFKVTPPGLVWLNNEIHGIASGTITVRAGLYLFAITRPGYAPWKIWYRVKPTHTRTIELKLQEAPTPAPSSILAMSKEARQQAPGPATSQAIVDEDVDSVILVASGKPCTSTRCPVMFRWAKGAKWIKGGEGVLKGASLANKLAASWLVKKALVSNKIKQPQKAVGSNLKECRDHAQCFSGQRCVRGYCRKVTSLTQKWWFWTLIGVAIAGAATAIVVPLTLPPRPVIEVR
jgi:hypothetical protein